jgi:zinc transporter ZupT
MPKGRKKATDDSDSKIEKTIEQAELEKKPDSPKKVELEKKPDPPKKVEPEKKPDPSKKIEPERKKTERKANSKPKIEFNIHDGITWHDFAGIFLLIFKIFWFFVKIFFYPVFWVWNQLKLLKNFVRAEGEDRVMTEDERIFFESVPSLFIITGLVGGIILGILISLKINLNFDSFFADLNTDFIKGITRPIGGFFHFIYFDVFKGIILPFFQGILSIYDAIKNLYNQNPFLAFVMLVVAGVIITIVWITVQEKFGLTIGATFRKIIEIIFGTPKKAYNKALDTYQKFNRSLTGLLVGKERIRTRTQEFFKKTLLFTSIVSLWTFIAGIYIGSDPVKVSQVYYNATAISLVIFTSFVLVFAGFISGLGIFALITRYFDLMNRRRYIAPEFKR